MQKFISDFCRSRKKNIREVKRNMSSYAGAYSHIENSGGVPTLFVNGRPFTSAAYMTYLEKFCEYGDFTDAGYEFFSVPVLFSGRWISITEGFKPFKKGIFDEKGKPDFSVYDEAINRILAVCPDAKIIPRVNISMPVWWEKENPGEVNITAGGGTLRESFYSAKWRRDAEELLREFLRYSVNSEYSSHIIGYQLAAGNTEEWFHYDLNGGYCKNAENGFRDFLNEHYPAVEYKGLPDLSGLKKPGIYHNDEYLAHFLEYASFAAADSICYLAGAAKEETGNNVVIGAFYGYSLEVTSPLHGTHALKYLLGDKSIDFICSPNSYIYSRDYGCDWTEMYPADSVRLHGKMCFQECDIRTHLTVLLKDKDPETDPRGNLSAPIWLGPDSKEQAISNIRKSFCRQLIKGNGLWWFDMWGGWYSDPDIMNEMKLFREIYTDSLTKSDRRSGAETAVFIDESAFAYMTECPLRDAGHSLRKNLGLCGLSYDMYDVFDFEEVCSRYKAVIFMSCAVTERMQAALKLCEENNIPYLIPSEEKESFSVSELMGFLAASGVTLPCPDGDILYINKNYAALCAQSGGIKTVNLGKKCRITGLIGGDFHAGSDTITIKMKKGEVRLFSFEESE